jgi:hypothetical protein
MMFFTIVASRNQQFTLEEGIKKVGGVVQKKWIIDNGKLNF